jgi:hypothetical protein
MSSRLSTLCLVVSVGTLAIVLTTSFALRSMSHDLCDRTDSVITPPFLMEHGFHATESQNKCMSTLSAVIAVCIIWISASMFLTSCAIYLIWYIKKLSEGGTSERSGRRLSEQDDIIDSRREQLDLEQDLLSRGGRDSRVSNVGWDSEGWEPVGTQ